MGSSGEGRRAPVAQRSRTVVVSFLGAIVRPMGAWMPIGGTVELLSQIGLDSASVRTAVSRLKANGWIESEARDGVRGYALTEQASATLAAGDEVIWHARQPADLSEGWCVVNFSVPESIRSKRYQLRSHLAHLGFGNVGTAMWIAPARMQPAAENAIAELGLGEYATIFVGDYAGPQDLTALLYASWDLTAIDQSYRDFAAKHEAQAAQVEKQPPEPREAFAMYMSLVDHWRKLPFRDPGLPTELLAKDWSGPAAAALFGRLVSILEKPALAHARTYWEL
ncbi:PaaX family transcriptional regulator C-terminal domain-containing protein [Nocardioides sp. Iso805N]|uniref:PaaX family transcriptional regulator n=1 Tax=Nocardioides sp. Iso805N TaxID=1283287 RepID=UPI0009D9C995|nr:PaaX family transcriptional regulator C-terminal domain-containing protein [Nocardioides sp. Iso805N]